MNTVTPDDSHTFQLIYINMKASTFDVDDPQISHFMYSPTISRQGLLTQSNWQCYPKKILSSFGRSRLLPLLSKAEKNYSIYVQELFECGKSFTFEQHIMLKRIEVKIFTALFVNSFK
jgi:hypothetical protein